MQSRQTFLQCLISWTSLHGSLQAHLCWQPIVRTCTKTSSDLLITQVRHSTPVSVLHPSMHVHFEGDRLELRHLINAYNPPTSDGLHFQVSM